MHRQCPLGQPSLGSMAILMGTQREVAPRLVPPFCPAPLEAEELVAGCLHRGNIPVCGQVS